MILLTNKEIKERWLEGYKEQNLTSDEFNLDNLSNNLYFEDMHALETVAKAQLQKVVEWLSVDCTVHDHGNEYMWRRRCWECLEALKKEAGI